MERKEPIMLQPEPVFAEGELDLISDENFKDFLTTFNERTKPEEEGGYDLQKTLLGVSDRLLMPDVGDPEEKVKRQMNWLDSLKSRAYFINSRRGPRNNTRSIVDRNNILLAISYLYNREQIYKDLLRPNISSVEILTRSVKNWGEHPMAGYIKDLLNSPLHLRSEKIGMVKRENGQRYEEEEMRPGVSYQTENNLTPEERQKILSEVNIDWLIDKIKAVEREMRNKPSLAYKITPNWTGLDIHPVVGEVMEYIRRENIQEESMIPLNQASLANLREGLKVALAYINKYPFIPNAAKLEEKIIQALKKLPK